MMAKSLTFIAAMVLACTCQDYEQQKDEHDQPYALVKPIPTQIVEDHEITVIDLTQHYSGSLLNYRIQVDGVSTGQPPPPIYLNSKWDNLAFNFMPQGDLASIEEPFPRSSILTDDDYGLLKMITLDKRLNLITYCFEGYLRNVVNQLVPHPLDPSIITGGTCQDLKHVSMNQSYQFLLVFCLTQKHSEAGTFQSNVTVVQIRNWETNDSSILYYTQPLHGSFDLDFTSPIRLVGNLTSVGIDGKIVSGDFCLFWGNFLNGTNSRYEPRFFWANLTIFEEMFQKNEVSRSGTDLLNHAVGLMLTNHTANKVIDYKTVFRADISRLSMAMVIETEGMLLCEVLDYRTMINEEREIVCIDDVNAFFNIDETAIAVHYEDFYHCKNSVFLVSASPPKVTEYNVANFRNHYIQKIFFSQTSVSKRYIGQTHIAVNKEQILHLMRDIFTNQYVIRVYSREATFFRIVLQDIPLPPQTRSPFFAFPNYYVNKFLYRDERTVNITQANFPLLIINRTQPHPKQDFNISVFTDQMYLGSFQVKFLEDGDVTTYPVYEQREVFYSCGDIKFNADVTKYYCGPSFRLDETFYNVSQGQLVPGNDSLFRFSKSQQNVIIDRMLPDSCQRSIMVSSKEGENFIPDTLTMVCVNLNKASFVSYLIPLHSRQVDTNMTPLSNVTVPESVILDFQYDPITRIIIAVVAAAGPQKEIHSSIELHYLRVEKTVQWVSSHPITKSTLFEGEPNIFGYSSINRRGLFVWNGNSTNGTDVSVVFLSFKIDFERYEMTDIRENSFNSMQGRVKKVAAYTEDSFLALTSSNTIIVFQIFPKILREVNQLSSYEQNRYIIDFDLIDEKYLVLYHNDSQTEVLTINTLVDIRFSQRLPLYERFKNFSYKFSALSSPQRDFFEGTLVIMLASTNETAYVAYKMGEKQHDSLYIANGTLEWVFDRSQSSSWIVLTGISDEFTQHYLGMVSDQRLVVVEVLYYDMIMTTLEKNDELLDACKNNIHNWFTSEIDSKDSHSQLVGMMEITPFSNLGNAKGDYQVAGQPLNVSIMTENLGLAILPSIHDEAQGNIIEYAYEQQEDQHLLLDRYLSGFNLDYEIECSRELTKGNDSSCLEYINQDISEKSYFFPIDLVTSERQPTQIYPMDEYYLVLDTQGSITLTKLPKRRDTLLNESVSLISLAKFNQTNQLGCTLYNSSYFSHLQLMAQTIEQSKFHLYYQCHLDSDGTKTLNVVEIILNRSQLCLTEVENFREKDCIKLSRYGNPEQFIYDIIDIDLVNLTSTQITENGTTTYNARLAVVCNLPFTYTNLLLVYNMTLSEGNFTQMKLLRYNSASKLGWDSFRVKTVEAIPDSQLLVATVDSFGTIIYHTGINEIVVKINLTEYEPSVSYLQQIGEPLKVFSTGIILPSVVQVYSNYGRFVFAFNHSFLEESAFMPQAKAKPYSWGIFRFAYQITEAQVATAFYGDALLVQSPSGRNTFDIKLLVHKFYADSLSKTYKSIKIASNRNCFSLHRNRFLESKTYDQLVVSFICESRLRLVEVNMRPNIKLGFTENPNNQETFNITIIARNDYSSNQSNVIAVPVTVNYRNLPEHELYKVHTIFFAILAIACVLLTLLCSFQSQSKGNGQKIVVEYRQKQTSTTYIKRAISKAQRPEQERTIQETNQKLESFNGVTALNESETGSRYSLNRLNATQEDDATARSEETE